MDQLMNGSNPKADDRLAADLGVTLSPEQDEICPPVILGNAGYETDASGTAIDRLNRTHGERRKIAFERGLIHARTVILAEMKKHAYQSDARNALNAAWEAVAAVNVDKVWDEITK